MSIKLSPKHGVNACIPICVFCGQQKNAVALLGKLKGDAKAPMNAIIDYEPCDECKKNWQKGIPLIRVSLIPPVENMPPLTEKNGNKLYPTGQYSVITTEGAKRIFEYEAPAGSPLLLDEQVFDDFMEQAEAAESMKGADTNETD